MARLPSITSKDQVAPKDHAIVDGIVQSRGALQGPFTMFLHCPELGGRLAHLGAFVRFEGSLDMRVRVLAAMTVARELDAVYVWGAQTGGARRLGVPETTITAIREQHSRGISLDDAQVHIWSGGKPGNPNHRQVASFTKDELLKEMAEAGVDAAIIHPPTSWDPNANELAVEAARQHPDRFAILGNFPLDRPESRALVDGWKKRPGMVGLRFTFLQPHMKTWPTDGTIDWLWPAAERAGLPIALMAANFLPKVGEVAQRHPHLKLILDHLGRPRGDTSSSERWANLADVVALAKYPNVAMKATGAPSYSDQPYPFRDIHDNLHRLYDAFGPARWFWGTDITRMPCPWRQCVTLFTEELPWLKGRDLELVMGRAVCDWLGWKR